MFEVAARPQSWKLSLPPTGILASLLLHVLLLALITVGQLPAPLELPPMRSVDVELIPLGQLAALAIPPSKPATIAVTPSPEPVPDTQPAAPSNGPFRAESFFAGSLLAEPASARLRAAMRTLADSERVVQLCDIEAIEQVRRTRPDYDPDMVVPYAMADMATAGGVLVATGGAFRSRREWYEISFSCRPSADLASVEAFEFTLGAEIPHEQWEAHYLTAEEAEE